MIRIRQLLAATIVVAVAACAPAPPPVVTPQGEARFLIDPRTGWTSAATPAVDRSFDTAWRYFLAGDYASARDRLAQLEAKNPAYAPAKLAEAAIAIREKRIEDARTIVNQLIDRYPKYTAASVYGAELDLAAGQLRSANERYRAIAAQQGAPPTVTERLGDIQTRLFDQLYGSALTARDEDAVKLLREALAINPAATAARVLLAQKLVAQQKFDEARRELDPVINSSDVDRPEVQESLAEIDIGKGRYQQAINRYERLTKRDANGRYARRLAEVKEKFAELNMPAQFQRALESESITRADLAVLMYWKVTAIRFAQDVPPPPIAIDIAEVPGRDELIRAIALGIFTVDPITRRVNPFAEVNAAQLARTVTRILSVRAAACAKGAGNPLLACGVDDPSAAGEELPVSGRTAAALLDQVDHALR